MHSLNKSVVEIWFINGIPGLSEAEICDDIHRHAAKGEEKVCRLVQSVLASQGGAKVVHLGTFRILWLM